MDEEGGTIMGWFLNLKTGVKLLSGFIIVALISGVVGYIGITNIYTIDDNDTILYEKMTVPISILAKISEDYQRTRINTRDAIIASTPQEVNECEKAIAGLEAEIAKNAKEFEKLIISAEMKDAYNDFIAKEAIYRSCSQQILAFAKADKDQEALALLNGDGRKAADASREALYKLVEMKNEDAKKTAENNTLIANAAVQQMFIIIGAGILLAILLGIYITRIVSNPLAELNNISSKIAAGDLSVCDIDNKRKDEIGNLCHSFNIMKANLKEVISNLVEGSSKLAASSAQVNGQAQQTSAGASETASTVSEISGTVQQVASNGQKVAEQAHFASSKAAEGKKSIDQVTGQMVAITETTGKVSKVISDLAYKSKEITQIVDVITNIADQTNLLALNAAIEAARAGDQGRGFAVVAEEVRKLAEGSGNAAEKIRTLITDIQDTSAKAVSAMETGTKEVEAGTIIVAEAGQNFVSIITTVTDLSSQVEDIAAAAEQMSSAVQNVAASSEEQTAAMEEVSAAVESLSALSEELKALGGKFKL